MCFGSDRVCHISDMFHVWYVVIYLSMAELKGAMCDSNWGNRC